MTTTTTGTQLTLVPGAGQGANGKKTSGSSWKPSGGGPGGGNGAGGPGSGSGSGSGGSGSSWTTQVAKTPNYSLLDFYIGASDIHGHGEKWTTKFPSDVAALVMLVVHNEDCPDYSSPQDFIRDAAVHRLNWIMDQLTEPAYREAIASSLSRILATEKLEAAKREVEFWTNWVTTFEATMLALQKVGNWERVWHHLQDMDSSVADGLTEPYKTMVRDHIAVWTARVPVEIREV